MEREYVEFRRSFRECEEEFCKNYMKATSTLTILVGNCKNGVDIMYKSAQGEN